LKVIDLISGTSFDATETAAAEGKFFRNFLLVTFVVTLGRR